MVKQVSLPKFNLQDFKQLALFHGQLEAVIRALDNTSWSGGRGCRAALIPIDLWVCDRYNLIEQTILRFQQRQSPPSSEPGQPEQQPPNRLNPIGQSNLAETE